MANLVRLEMLYRLHRELHLNCTKYPKFQNKFQKLELNFRFKNLHVFWSSINSQIMFDKSYNNF